MVNQTDNNLMKNKNKLILFSLFLLVFLSRWYFLGSSLWHDDAFSFVDKAISLAVNGQYLNAHSTGYPFLVVFLALIMKVGHFLTNQWSIVFLSNLTIAVFGSLLVFPIYALSKKILDNPNYAFLATTAVIFNPIIWRWSEVAMSDVFALFFVLYTIVFFMKFIETDRNKYLWLSNLFLYFGLMSRVLYALIVISFAIYWFVNNRKEFNFKKVLILLGGWITTIFLMIFTYGLFNNFNFFSFLSNYGSVTPTFKESIASSLIILKSVGFPMFLMSGLGLVYLFKKNRKYFYLTFTLLAVFFVYLSSWYRNGWFDIERYSMLLTIILLLVAGYCLVVNRTTRILFISSFIILIFLFLKGVNQPLDQYRTYGFSDGYFADYMIKAAQLNQQTKTDLDLQTYQDLAGYIDNQDVVFHWQNDWIMPKLLLSGAHLENKALLVSIESEEDLEKNLAKYQDRKIYLLRGAYDTYLGIMSEHKPVKSGVLNNRSVVNFIPDN